MAHKTVYTVDFFFFFMLAYIQHMFYAEDYRSTLPAKFYLLVNFLALVNC